MNSGCGGGAGERVTWQLTLPYVKHIANGNLLDDSGNSSWGSVRTEKGRMGRKTGGRFKRKRTYVYLWLTCGCLTENSKIL